MNPLILTGALLIIAGIAGCIFSVIPGLILSYISLILLSFVHHLESYSPRFLILMGIVVSVITALDFLVPKWRKKKYGASRPGMLISVIGMLIGLWLFPPWGIIIGAFIGGLIGEILVRKQEKSAFKAGAGVFIGTIFGIMLKICITGLIAHYFLKEATLYNHFLFSPLSSSKDALIRVFVYGCFGLLKISSVGPCSTTFPSRITTIS